MSKVIMHLRHWLLYALLVTALQGCGMRGDLYLPDENSPTEAGPAATEAGQAESFETVESADAEGFYTEAPEDADDENSDENEDNMPDSVIPPTP